MNLDRGALFQLLPSLYRLRDADRGGALGALLDVVAEQLQVLQEDLAQLYDDQFIETCADWVVPYIGDLIGYRQLNGVTARIRSPRAEVANTIHLRRGKGTVAVLEGLARDVTGWDAHVVEYFLQLAVTQSTKHLRPGRGGTVDLRRQPLLERIGSPFDSVAHTADFRGLGGNGGRYNLPNVGIHLWRLGSAGLSRATAFRLDATRFFFNPLGADIALYNRPAPVSGDTALAAESNLPLAISRRGLAANPTAFGTDASIFVEGLPEGTTVLAADLSDLDAAGTQWAHTAAAGTLLLDPERGRLVFATAQASAPRVSFRHGSAAELGGGEYERLATLSLTLKPVSEVQTGAGGVQAALKAVATGGAAELPDSGTYAETPTITLAPNAVVEMRGADQTRPLLQLGGELAISGGAGAELILNGLVISGGALRVTAGPGGAPLRRLRLVHCTLVPGLTLQTNGSAAHPGAPSLIVETEGTQVELDHCIVGALRIAAESSLSLTACVVDAGDPAGVALAGIDGAAPGAALQASGSTLIGRVHSAALQSASECVFHARGAVAVEAKPWPAPVWSERRQEGCVRFSYLPLEALVPRRYRCQPSASADASRVQPMFASLRYGDAAYARLARRTAPEILVGAEDGGEMGVHHKLGAQQRESNLRLRLAEYLRVGLDGGLLFAD
jgi:hypothetical protein